MAVRYRNINACCLQERYQLLFVNIMCQNTIIRNKRYFVIAISGVEENGHIMPVYIHVYLYTLKFKYYPFEILYFVYFVGILF